MITKYIKKAAKGVTYLLLYSSTPLLLASCSDTWDDHYEGTVAGANDGSLWEAIRNNSELSNFSSVIEATGYDKSLGSSQVFTVFAPTNANFSKSEADELIAQYKQEKKTVNDADNTVIKEFVQNHIALYNHSVSPSSNDSIVLMNGKYAVLKSGALDNSSFQLTNQLYGNGVLFTVSEPVHYSANVFEYMRKDAELDSVRAFLYNPWFYYKKFNPASSVEGGIDELGRTIYLDSAFVQRNDLFEELGEINSEDSTYWMVVPTNDQWRLLLEQYEPYFKYDTRIGNQLTVGSLDSLIYTNTRMAILKGTTFSRTVNKNIFAGVKSSGIDSVYSTNAVLDYNLRNTKWGNNFNYFQYFNPLASGGVLDEADSVSCSNGRVMKVHDWKLNQLQTFNRWIVVQAESAGSIKEISTSTDKNGNIVPMASNINRSVTNNEYKKHVWNSSFVEFQPTTTSPYDVTFNIKNVLSNMGYDIYLVSAPAAAADSNAVDTLGTKLRCSLKYYDHDGKAITELLTSKHTPRASSSNIIETKGTEMDYILLAEDYKFPVCTYGVKEDEPEVRLFVENRTLNSDLRDGKFNKITRIDCILLVPHGTLQLVDDLGEYVSSQYQGMPGLMMFPHGNNLMYYYMFR